MKGEKEGRRDEEDYEEGKGEGEGGREHSILGERDGRRGGLQGWYVRGEQCASRAVPRLSGGNEDSAMRKVIVSV